MDEAAVQFKGRFSCLTYSPINQLSGNTNVYFGRFKHWLCVYNISLLGFTLEFLISPGLYVSARIVLNLYNNLPESIPDYEGYHLYVDRYFFRVLLAETLLKKCYLTGTIRSDRNFQLKGIRKPASKIVSDFVRRKKPLSFIMARQTNYYNA